MILPSLGRFEPPFHSFTMNKSTRICNKVLHVTVNRTHRLPTYSKSGKQIRVKKALEQQSVPSPAKPLSQPGQGKGEV